MANETTSPEALAAADAFNNTVDTLVQQQQMQQMLQGVNLSGLAGVQHTGNEQVAARPVGDMSQGHEVGR